MVDPVSAPGWPTDGGSRAASPPGSPQAAGPAPMLPVCDEDMLDADPMQLDDPLPERPSSPAAAPPSGVVTSSGSTVVGALSYDCNIWSHRGPRRMAVALSNPLMDTLLAANADAASVQHSPEHGAVVAAPPAAEELSPVSASALALGAPEHEAGAPPPPPALGGGEHDAGDALLASHVSSPGEFAVLRNKAPRWHETYQCWCLDFGGRVTTASVKNFQLTAGGQGRVLMQFGRTSHKDVFVMDFQVSALACWLRCLPSSLSDTCVATLRASETQHPLSAVQAFAVALSAFDSKLACR